jgi:hypothetical protein
MKLKDGFLLTTLWRKAVADDATILGFFDWVVKEHADKIIEYDPPPVPSHWQSVSAAMQQDVDALAVRIDDLERDLVSPENIHGMIDVRILKLEQRIRDAFVCASRSISP